ncbi:metabolite traffic protein EboE [Allostreptomyces psammosilenae]|uniref:Sugar phosphate isomerase/epimerase n=1 Tax=Allostreptomyces psammosilenae TaxID=1892865 RepID=A0A853A0E3_9ACTN|nr:metabolite traffic protein EboE [Allostreptomyces psammosilenae]NYI03858.1 sugar phosphate isomerase/epimerase [Allostreptomyces psammosilenae]
MRLRHRDGTIVHLAYCTNVHPVETLPDLLDRLDRHAVPAAALLGDERLGGGRLGVGLWLPAPVAAHLAADPAAVRQLRAELTARGLETVTLNGFPYRGFGDPIVKGRVYHPDWTTPDRARYTADLARVLAGLLPDDAARGSVSTLPLAWRTPWDRARAAQATERLRALGHALADIEACTGRTIRVGLEPEPGCVIETTEQALEHLGVSEVDTERVGVCLDACHLAVAHEEPGTALDRLTAAGVPVVKTQASCAMVVPRPADPEHRRAAVEWVEPRYLHQVREASGGRAGVPPLAVDDLPEALEWPGGLPARNPWRVHFHVPLHADPPPPLTTTRPALLDTLDALFGGRRALTDHVEVETYTWTALPDGVAGTTRHRDRDLATDIAAELDWTRRALVDLGLRTPNDTAPAVPLPEPTR